MMGVVATLGFTAQAQAQETFTVDNQVSFDLHRIYFYCVDDMGQAVTHVFGPIYASATVTYTLPHVDHITGMRIYCTAWDQMSEYWSNETFCVLFGDTPNSNGNAVKLTCDGNPYYFRGAKGSEDWPNCMDGGFIGINMQP